MGKNALLLIDVQNDYFKGGLFPLKDMESAAKQAARLLAAFREKGLPVVHVRHENPSAEAPFFRPGSGGALIHPEFTPQADEPLVVKQHANAFKGTNLKQIMDEKGVDSVLIAGAMSNMCIDAVTRAASDLGYRCAVAHDACAAMDLALGSTTVPAGQVHAAFMAALGLGYANVAACDALLENL